MSEFSRPFSIENLRAGGADQHLEARTAERVELARRFDLPAIDKVTADLTIRQRSYMPGQYEVEGQARAELRLICSVSGEEYPHLVEDTIRAIFVNGPVPAHTEDMAIDFAWDDPETLENGTIDLGELVAQHIMLAIPPYPRKPEARWDGPNDEDGSAPAAKESPFAVLQDLKKP